MAPLYLTEAGFAYISELTSSSSRASEHPVAFLFSNKGTRVNVIGGSCSTKQAHKVLPVSTTSQHSVRVDSNTAEDDFHPAQGRKLAVVQTTEQ